MHVSRRGRILAVGAVLAGLGAAGGFAYHHFDGPVLRERCTADAAAGEISLSLEQAANAATIAGVAVRRELPERAAVIALAVALQESMLVNLPEGDRDSLGLFQQRPSQGWGTESQIIDPVYSAGRFYDALVKIPRYAALPLTVAAQRVQRSGAPDAYAKHETEAQVLGDTLTGRAPAGFTCAVRPSGAPRQAAGADGLTPLAAAARARVVKTFGRLRTNGYAGESMDVVFRPATSRNRRDGWALAHWAVAQADALRIETVIYDGRIWTARRSARGWREYRPQRTRTDATLARDHVHLTVAGRG